MMCKILSSEDTILSCIHVVRYFSEVSYLSIFKIPFKVPSHCKILSAKYFNQIFSVKQQLYSADDYFIKFIFIHSLVNDNSQCHSC